MPSSADSICLKICFVNLAKQGKNVQLYIFSVDVYFFIRHHLVFTFMKVHNNYINCYVIITMNELRPVSVKDAACQR